MIRGAGPLGSLEVGQPWSNLFGNGIAFERYNIAMPASGATRQPDPGPPEPPASGYHRPPQICTLEATGPLVMAALLLIVTLARYWHHSAWSAR
jgi:hypothetical protein